MITNSRRVAFYSITSANALSPNAGYAYAFTAPYDFSLPIAFTLPNASAPHNAFNPNVISLPLFL